jgi:YVTN family beta-propeller protein
MSPAPGRSQRIPEGSLGLYVHFYCPAHEEISFTIQNIQAVAADGAVIVRPADQTLEAGSDWRQILIEANLPTGSYQRIGLSFTKPVLHRSSAGDVPLQCSENDYAFLDLPFLITPQKTVNAYINLEVKSESNKSKGAAGDTALLFSPRLSQGKKPAGLKSLMLYVTNTADNTVSVLDRLTNSLISTIQVGKSPKGIVVNPRGTYAYVANSGSNTVSIIDTMTNEVEDTIDLPLGLAPSNLTITSDGKYVFTANTDSDNVSMIDTELKKVIDTIGVGHRPVDLQVSPSGQWLYVVNQGSSDLYVIRIDGTSLEDRQLAGRIPLQSEPAGVTVAGDGLSTDRLFIANFGSSSLSLFEIDPGTLKDTDPRTLKRKLSILQGEAGPTRLVLGGDRLYVTNQKDNSVSSFLVSSRPMSPSANVQESRYQVGKKPIGLVLDSSRNYLYVVNSADDSISIIDLRQEHVVESIKVGREPFGIDGIDLILK